METQVGLKTIALTLFLNLFFCFLVQLLCVMISHWLTVLKHKMQSQILIKQLDWFGKCRAPCYYDTVILSGSELQNFRSLKVLIEHNTNFTNISTNWQYSAQIIT